MASDDVIELGSSDDEPEPAPKKMKPSLDAMVHIASENIDINKIKNTARTVDRKISVPQSNNKIAFFHTNNKTKIQPKTTIIKPIQTFMKVNACPSVNLINPIKIKKHNIKQFVAISPKISQVHSINPFVKHLHVQSSNIGINPLYNRKTHNQKCLTKLPPEITVKRTTGNEKKNVNISEKVMIVKRQMTRVIPKATEVLTVDLDEDDTPQSSRSHPAWCLKPEEQPDNSTLQMKNNKEPEPQSVEIIIEDSPIKLSQNTLSSEIGRVLEITVDSPVKSFKDNNLGNKAQSDKADTEVDNIEKKRTPSSKKKLEYPSEALLEQQSLHTESTIEKDAPQTETDILVNKSVEQISKELKTIDAPGFITKCNKNDKTNINNQAIGSQSSTEPVVIEIFDSPAKKHKGTIVEQDSANPKEKHIEKTKSTINCLIVDKEMVSANTEFHPVYQNFIDTCLQFEDTDDMKKIVQKKIKAYYKEVSKTYTESEEFIEMVSSKVMAIQADPARMYLYIKDIVDELNLQRKIEKAQPAKEKLLQSDDDDEVIEVQDLKKQNQINKLEKALKKLYRAIQKLEEQEVDFDDEADSVYLLTESKEGNSSVDSEKPSNTDKNSLLLRYKERLVRVYAKLCKLTNTKLPSELHVHIEPRPGRPKGPAERLEKWVNKKVPSGTPIPFPDFHDVVRCVKEANEADKLGWNDLDIMEEARDLFMRCGKKLQRRRQENEWRVASSRMRPEVDPAETSQELKKKLDENKKIAVSKEADIIKKYVDRQTKLKLEAQEIEDKDAEQSPVESDDSPEEIDDVTNENQNKKRKTSSPKKPPFGNTEDESMKISSEIKINTHSESIQDDIQVITDDAMTIEPTIKNNKEDKERENSSLKDQVTSMDIDEQINKPIKPPKDINNTNDSKDTSQSIDLSSDDDDEKKARGNIKDGGLLRVFHFENETSSALDSSDLDGPIAISDTLSSSCAISSDKEKNSSDVVSIEQSSNSDSEQIDKPTCDKEETCGDKSQKKDLLDAFITEGSPGKTVANSEELWVPSSDSQESCHPKKFTRQSNEEYTEPIENILLASEDESIPDVKSEDEVQLKKSVSIATNYINLKDDVLSIEETVPKVSTELSNDMTVVCVDKELSDISTIPTLDADAVKEPNDKNVVCSENNIICANTEQIQNKENYGTKTDERENITAVIIDKPSVCDRNISDSANSEQRFESATQKSKDNVNSVNEIAKDKNDIKCIEMEQNKKSVPVAPSTVNNEVSFVVETISKRDEIDQKVKTLINTESHSSIEDPIVILKDGS